MEEDEPLPGFDVPGLVPPPDTDPAMSAGDCIIGGTFALYHDGNGGFVLVTDTTERGIERQHLPKAMVRLASRLGVAGSKVAGIIGG